MPLTSSSGDSSQWSGDPSFWMLYCAVSSTSTHCTIPRFGCCTAQCQVPPRTAPSLVLDVVLRSVKYIHALHHPSVWMLYCAVSSTSTHCTIPRFGCCTAQCQVHPRTAPSLVLDVVLRSVKYIHALHHPSFWMLYCCHDGIALREGTEYIEEYSRG